MASISPDIVALVNSLVAEGLTDVSEVQAHIRLKVRGLFSGRPEPKPLNQRFYLSRRDIRNMIYWAKCHLRDGKNDIGLLEERLKQWGDEVIYRSFTRVSGSDICFQGMESWYSWMGRTRRPATQSPCTCYV